MTKTVISKQEIEEILEIIYGKEAGEIKDFEKFLKDRVKSSGGLFGFMHEFLELFIGLLMSNRGESQQLKLYSKAILSFVDECVKP